MKPRQKAGIVKTLTITLAQHADGGGWTAFLDREGSDHPGVSYGPEIDVAAVLEQVTRDLEHAEFMQQAEIQAAFENFERTEAMARAMQRGRRS